MKIITPPSTLPVSVAEAKANGRIDHDAEDSLIEAYIRAALAFAEKYSGRAFEPQVVEVTLDAFPDAEIELPFGPVVSISNVTFTDADGDEQTVDSADYVVDTASRDGWLVPAYGASWPSTMDTINAVRVRYVAGEGTPDDVKQAILLLVQHYYEHRATAAEKAVVNIPMGAQAILDLNRRIYI